MRPVEDQIRNRLRQIPKTASRTAVFVGMVGPLATVNVGDESITIPCVGFYPPVAGMVVQLEQRNGQLVVTGPAVPLNPIGTISGTGSPKATVTVDGTDYVLWLRSGYTPVIGDQVSINWTTTVIDGKITGAGTSNPAPTQNPGGSSGALSTAPVLATGSGQYRSRWQSNDVRASDSVSGAWFYGTRLRTALKGSTPTQIQIYLPLRQSLGVCNIGVHTSSSQPGGYVSASLLTPLDHRGGWVTLPLSFATFLRDNTGGIAVTSGNGDNQWAGTQADPLSGALRFKGSR